MDKPLTSTVTLDLDTVARIEKRAGETGLTPSEFVAELVRTEGIDLRRWAEVEAGGELIPHEDVKRWLKTWGTPDYKPWSKSR